METFCRETITDIKMAKDEADLIHVISASLSRLRKERNSFNETGYIMNMIVSLRSMNTGDLSTGSIDNIKLATAIFRQLQTENRQRIF
jgi:hypothetical protein